MEDQVKTPQKTNALAVIGLITVFFIPLAGLVVSEKKKAKDLLLPV